MTREEIIDLLTFARVYDSTVTVGRAEAAAWFLALNRVPLTIAQAAVTEHYTAPTDPGRPCPRIQPGHIMGFYRAGLRADGYPVLAIETAPATPEHKARCRERINQEIARAAAKFALKDADPDEVPKWRPGMDKQELALRQAEAARRQRMAGGV